MATSDMQQAPRGERIEIGRRAIEAARAKHSTRRPSLKGNVRFVREDPPLNRVRDPEDSDPFAKRRSPARRNHAGTPGRLDSLGRGRYRVESWTHRGSWYEVDLEEARCSCPDHSVRGPECKHVEQAREESKRQVFQAALSLPAEEIERHLERQDLRPEQVRGIRTALWVKTFRARPGQSRV